MTAKEAREIKPKRDLTGIEDLFLSIRKCAEKGVRKCHYQALTPDIRMTLNDLGYKIELITTFRDANYWVISWEE